MRGFKKEPEMLPLDRSSIFLCRNPVQGWGHAALQTSACFDHHREQNYLEGSGISALILSDIYDITVYERWDFCDADTSPQCELDQDHQQLISH